MYRPRVGCYAVYEPPEEGWENWQAQHRQICDDLQDSGLDIITAPEAVKDPPSMARVAAFFAGQEIDLLHALIITWSFDHYTIELQQKLGLPVAIRAIPGIRTGSLVGAQQLGCVLADIEKLHRLFYGMIGNDAVAQQTATNSAGDKTVRFAGGLFSSFWSPVTRMVPVVVARRSQRCWSLQSGAALDDLSGSRKMPFAAISLRMISSSFSDSP